MQRLSLLFPYLLFGLIAAVVVMTNVPANGPAPVPRPARCEPCGMKVDPETAARMSNGGPERYLCSEACFQRASAEDPERRPRGTSGDSAAGTPAGQSVQMDVVCNMEVNAAWGIRADYDGTRHYFCTDRCKDRFLDDPESYLTPTCMVCNNALAATDSILATYLGKTYELCSEEHRTVFKADPASFFMHSMWGIPSWLYYLSIAIVMIVSFGVFDWFSRSSTRWGRQFQAGRKQEDNRKQTDGSRAAPTASMAAGTGRPAAVPRSDAGNALQVVPGCLTAGAGKFDLLRLDWVNGAVRSRKFRFVLQFAVVAVFLLIVSAGLFGNQNPAINIAPLLTWTIWWGLLPLLILFAGKAWCYVCPWDAMAGWLEKLRFWKKADQGLSMNYRWPRIVRNISVATLLFVGLTWVELGFGVTMKPRVTAYLAIGMLFLAVFSAMLFEKKSFCRYGCLVGRVSGLYALFGGMEVRSRYADICRSCSTKECVTGSDTAYGCPTFLYPGKLDTNTYCIQCMECVQACPHDNLAVNLRPWGSDLAAEGKPRSDEAYLALVMLSITGFHGLTMTPVWQQLIAWLRDSAGVGRVLGFSGGMALILFAPVAVYAALVGISRQLGHRDARKPLSYRDYFIRYAYALLPIALFYHIAHNMEHLLMEGPKLLALLSDPFGWNWNLFQSASWSVPPLISLSNLWLVQVLLVLIGHVYSLWVAQKTSLRLFGSSSAAFKSQVPMLIGMIAFSVFSLWLLKQPMEMRTSAM